MRHSCLTWNGVSARKISRKCHPGGSTGPSFLTPQHPGLCPNLLLTQRGTEREGAFIKHLLHASCYFMVKETESQESKGPVPDIFAILKQESPPGTKLRTLGWPRSYLLGPEPTSFELSRSPGAPPPPQSPCPLPSLASLPHPQEAEHGEMACSTVSGTRP